MPTMKRAHYNEEQIAFAVEAGGVGYECGRGPPVEAVSPATFYRWSAWPLARARALCAARVCSERAAWMCRLAPRALIASAISRSTFYCAGREGWSTRSGIRDPSQLDQTRGDGLYPFLEELEAQDTQVKAKAWKSANCYR
jgi:hypothetical protein